MRLRTGRDLQSETFYWRIFENSRESKEILRIHENSGGFSRILPGFAESPRIARGNHAQTMRINSERLETDHFHRRVSGRITFRQLFSPSEPGGSQKHLD